MRSSGVDIVLNLTWGLGAFLFPERVRHLEDCLPEIASLDITTGNQVEGDLEFVYLNTTRTLRQMAKRFHELNIRPELELFGADGIRFGAAFVAKGPVHGPAFFSDGPRRALGRPATVETILYQKLPSALGASGSKTIAI